MLCLGSRFVAFEGMLHLEDDIALVLPVAILIAGRAERVGRNAMLLRLVGRLR